MSDYTPTTEWMRFEWVACHEDDKETFDRWLAQVRAETWDAAVGEVCEQGTVQVPDNPYRDEPKR